MSKKYDEYASQFISEHSSIDIQGHLEPRFQELDPELAREIRDRAIIDFVKMADKVGVNVSYGDVLNAIDHNPAEKEYEKSKAQQKS